MPKVVSWRKSRLNNGKSAIGTCTSSYSAENVTVKCKNGRFNIRKTIYYVRKDSPSTNPMSRTCAIGKNFECSYKIFGDPVADSGEECRYDSINGSFACAAGSICLCN